MINKDIQTEIDENFAYFQTMLPDLLRDHRNRYALLRSKEIVGIYDTIRDAQTTGDRFFPDRIYSIQKVSDVPVDLEFFSHAGLMG